MEALFVLFLLAAAPAEAQEIRTPLGQQGRSELPRPVLGQSMASVRARWGEPLHIHAPVGQPPITRWDYPDFTVYFEYSHVLTTVMKRTPPPPIVIEQEVPPES